MASSSKPTGVHYALVVFVLFTIVCGLGWLLAYKGNGSIGELHAQNVSLAKKAGDADTLLKQHIDDIERLKKALGSGFEKVGDDPNISTTVYGDLMLQMKNFSAGLQSPTLIDLIAKMNEALRNANTSNDERQKLMATELGTFNREKEALNAALAAEKKARDEIAKSKTAADTIHAEEIGKKEQDVTELRKANDTVQQDYAEYKEATDKARKQSDQRVANLLKINRQLRKEIEETTQTTFEVADGKITFIDPVARKVWINLGSVDGLRVRTSFSVYKKNNSGVGRGSRPHEIGPEDIKGSIEVMKIAGPHLAEARITDEDLYTPMGKGDPIFSPLWSPGRGEAFSIVGIADLDGDGRDDRDLLHELVTAAGATIDNEVDDNGVLYVNGETGAEKPKLSEKTKFFVKGKIPDLLSTSDSDRIAILGKIYEFQKEMDEQAQERAIRVVSLGDFLSFMGYRTQRRLFVPGGETPYTLQNGSRGPMAEKSKGGSKASGGATAGAYSEDPLLKPKTMGTPGKGNGKVFRPGAGK
ncbi:MAG: hypothetical protein EXS05_08550 [Planctomycetaceae bacterium]|nr:hypothetical protein [Planctomycetaceae bacterium]